MQRIIVLVALATVALITGSRAVSAQQTESRIVVTVTDPNGAASPGHDDGDRRVHGRGAVRHLG